MSKEGLRGWFTYGVRWPVDFNRQFQFWTIEVERIFADAVLSPKFESEEFSLQVIRQYSL